MTILTMVKHHNNHMHSYVRPPVVLSFRMITIDGKLINNYCFFAELFKWHILETYALKFRIHNLLH